MPSDIYICAVYIPSANSSYSKSINYDILELIEKDLTKYKAKGEVMICGDFNARTASEVDFISQDSPKYLPLFDSYKNDDTMRVRNNNDVVLDTRGKELLELCICNQLRIANGRCFGDIFGKYTCFNPSGQSTVYYLLIFEGILSHILYYRVSDFIPLFSDCHCKISWEILAKFKNECHNTASNMTKKISINFKWKQDSSEKFQCALNLNEVQLKINQFQENSKHVSSASEINKVVSEFNDILITAANLSLSKPSSIGKRRKNKKWFDTDLRKLRDKVISQDRLYGRFPKNLIIKGHYYKLYRQYNKLRKTKY